MHILQVRQELSTFWPTLACEIPQQIIGQVAPPPVMDFPLIFLQLIHLILYIITVV